MPIGCWKGCFGLFWAGGFSNLHKQFFNLNSSEIQTPKPIVFDIVTTHNDQLSMSSMILDFFVHFIWPLGAWAWELHKGLRHLLLHLTLKSSTSKFPNQFFDVLLSEVPCECKEKCKKIYKFTYFFSSVT